MIRVHFVGDGERDAATVPCLVRGVLKKPFHETTARWARLHEGGRGYSRKLFYAVRQARAEGAQALVATIDDDKSRGRRYDKLLEARKRDRERGVAFPTALGCAVPHVEAWLLDDAAAVRRALHLPGEQQIPNVRRLSSPKASLHDLMCNSSRASDRPIDVCRDIASCVDCARCPNAKQTGFQAFVEEITIELGPVFQTD